MSDISMPPEPPQPPKKHFLDNAAVKTLFTLMALIAPVPVLLALVNLWISCLAPETMKGADAFTVFRQIMQGGGAAPVWLAPLALVPSLVLLMIMYRSGAGRIAAAAALVTCAAAGVFSFMQMISL